MNRQTISAVSPGEVAARSVVIANAQAENRMDAPSAQAVGQPAHEGRGQSNTGGGSSQRKADAHLVGVEGRREQRQQRVRDIEVSESREAGKNDWKSRRDGSGRDWRFVL